MPYISTEALVGGALVIALALGYQYIPLPSTSAAGTSSSSSKKKNKNKKKSSKGAGSGQEEQSNTKPVESAHRQTSKLSATNGDIAKPAAKDGAAESSTATAPQKTKPKTLAQKIAPQPRKSKVDDMLAPEDLPGQHARVMRVTGQTSSPGPPVLAPPVVEPEQKVEKFTDDYASSSDEEEKTSPSASGSGGSQMREDDGWGVVSSKKKKPISINFSSSNPQTATSLPLPTATKVQRKNQKKAEANKAARAAEEEERLRRLAMHKRQLEKAKIDDLYGASKKKSGNTGGQASGGSKATLDHNGKLIWD